VAVNWTVWMDRLRPLTESRRGILLGGAVILGLGVVIGLIGGRAWSPASRPLPTAAPVVSSALPSAAQVAAAPHPTLVLPNDPPATETSPHTVLDSEPPPVETQMASVALPPVLPAGSPDWQKYAQPSPPTGGRPMIAVIIDDMGLDRKRSEQVLQLPGPLTISFMSYAEALNRQSEEARAHGHELMMHVPMEPMGEGIDPGPGALLNSLPPDELRRRVVDDLDRFKGYVGINNHMGSKFTAYAPGMQVVMEELHRRGLLFIDSLTTDHSVGLDLAHRAGVPTAGRNVFLDNEADAAAVQAQLARTEDMARKKGNAIAIGHPRDVTIAVLAAWLPTLEQKGFVLVPVTAVVKARMTTATAATH